MHKVTFWYESPVLETDRLVLRRMSKADADDMFEYASLPAVTRFLTWDEHPDRRFSYNYLAYLGSRYRAGEFYDWALVYRENDKMIGTCGFTRFNFSANSGEVGFVAQSATGIWDLRGEAVCRVIRFGSTTLGFTGLRRGGNMGRKLGSRSVMERAGMRFEGMLRGLPLREGH